MTDGPYPLMRVRLGGLPWLPIWLRALLAPLPAGAARRRLVAALTRWRIVRVPVVEPARLAEVPDGRLVRTRGRIVGLRAIPPLLGGPPAVFRRTDVNITVPDGLGGKAHHVVHEAAAEFDLVDALGFRVRIDPGGGHLLHRAVVVASPHREALERLAALPAPKDLLRRWRDSPILEVEAGEFLLREGDAIEAVGRKESAVDPLGIDRVGREVPMVATLRSSAWQPLLLVLPGLVAQT